MEVANATSSDTSQRTLKKKLGAESNLGLQRNGQWPSRLNHQQLSAEVLSALVPEASNRG